MTSGGAANWPTYIPGKERPPAQFMVCRCSMGSSVRSSSQTQYESGLCRERKNEAVLRFNAIMSFGDARKTLGGLLRGLTQD